MWIPCAPASGSTRPSGYKRGVIPSHNTENKGILKLMPSPESSAQAVRRQLQRILESSGFVRNERLSSFLTFVVERHLQGRDHELKESVIAVEILGRRPDYNPKQDPIVRTEAGRLRARLSEYYIGEGRSDPLVIELPKGGYTPVFRGPAEAISSADQAAPAAPADPSARGRAWLLVAIAGLAVALAAVGWWVTHHKDVPLTIAVLPLENLGHEPANDYFADGLTDELIRNLSGIDGLAVRSRTSSFAFKAKSRNVREAGMQLRANYILEGSVLRAGQQLRINVQLIRVIRVPISGRTIFHTLKTLGIGQL
jgi:hypothetical protein